VQAGDVADADDAEEESWDGRHRAERILTTHAGSLPKPDDLIQLIWRKSEGGDVDEALLAKRVAEPVKSIVEQQRDAGVDIVRDGEVSKPGFSTYIYERVNQACRVSRQAGP
jgi:5-methyltetrahydropteroyltriglutamate--homocysteine methyltransferase